MTTRDGKGFLDPRAAIAGWNSMMLRRKVEPVADRDAPGNANITGCIGETDFCCFPQNNGEGLGYYGTGCCRGSLLTGGSGAGGGVLTGDAFLWGSGEGDGTGTGYGHGNGSSPHGGSYLMRDLGCGFGEGGGVGWD